MSTETAERNRVKRIQGVVTSSKRDKTITVTVRRKVPHELYNKFIARDTKYHAHDEKNEANEGDTVEIIESRPMSKTKRWRLAAVIRKGASE